MSCRHSAALWLPLDPRPASVAVEMPTSQFEVVTTKMGVLSIRDNVTQEIMHNPVGPWAEANALYIEQSSMRERLLENVNEELVIFDVGLGAAANALAALHCARGSTRPVRIVSFERDLNLLRFALANANRFAHFQGFEKAVETLLDHGKWSSENIAWELRHGNFPDLIVQEKLRAELIFFDPYSAKKNTEMWTADIFRKVRAASGPRAMLFTYSRATPVRVGMFLGGFFVGVGHATGAKDETTQAAVRVQDLKEPLGPAWLGTWQRSHHPYALGESEAAIPATRDFILNHPQFKVN